MMNLTKRKWIHRFAVLMIYLMTLLSLIPLMSILVYVTQKGLHSFGLDFFTELPKPVGEEGGGLGNAVLGSLTVVTLAVLMGLPFGLGIGIYLSEFSKDRFSKTLRWVVDLLSGIPSIVIGIFAYAVLVVPFKGFSSLAGSLALALIFIPSLARTTEEILKLVPDHLREAGLALGLPRSKVILKIIVAGSKSGLLTSLMLVVARISGETAPLLFTALNSQYWTKSIFKATSTLPVQIYTYAISPFDEWNHLAWTGAFVLVLFVSLSNLAMRWVIFKNENRK